MDDLCLASCSLCPEVHYEQTQLLSGSDILEVELLTSPHSHIDMDGQIWDSEACFICAANPENLRQIFQVKLLLESKDEYKGDFIMPEDLLKASEQVGILQVTHVTVSLHFAGLLLEAMPYHCQTVISQSTLDSV